MFARPVGIWFWEIDGMGVRLGWWLAVVLCTSVAGGAQGDDAQVREAVKKAKIALETAFDTGDREGVQRGITDHGISISTHWQFFSRAAQVKSLDDYKVTSYKMSQFKVLPICDEAAQLTYLADVDATYQGKKMPPHVRVVETWVLENDRWLQASYQETPVPGSDR